MNLRRCSLLVLAVAAGTVSWSGAAEAKRGVTQSLFDGKSLHGWAVTDCETVVKDGELILASGNGFVRSEHRYDDFVLELDWKALKPSKYDSGIYFRAELPPKTGRPWPLRYQSNLAEGMEGNVKNLAGAESSGLIKPGEWNHFKLTAIGKHAELEINGKPAWKTDAVEAPTGYIGLQAEVPLGGAFAFKNIRITELGYDSLFDGTDLSHWEGANAPASDCWEVKDGEIACTGKRRGTWLRSLKEYGDFNLRLEYKLLGSGNSGVYLRTPKGGAHRGQQDPKAVKGEPYKTTANFPGGSEVQLQEDAGAMAKYGSRLKPTQYCAGIYLLAAPSAQVGRPPGQWNSMEINCSGPNIRVIHNGVLVVDATPEKYPGLPDRRQAGYLGLQNHSSQVWFRNIRIGPAQP